VGDRPAGETQLSRAPRRSERDPADQPTRRSPAATPISSSIGEAMRSRLENPRQRYRIGPRPPPQSLERGSSVTNNSLAANQRPNISLIDRRHCSARRVPSRVPSTPPCRKRQSTARPIDSNKPYQRRH
jgi:hypothetical protein